VEDRRAENMLAIQALFKFSWIVIGGFRFQWRAWPFNAEAQRNAEFTLADRSISGSRRPL